MINDNTSATYQIKQSDKLINSIILNNSQLEICFMVMEILNDMKLCNKFKVFSKHIKCCAEYTTLQMNFMWNNKMMK